MAALGLNARDNLFGPGCRANATVGRAVMLTLRNVCAAVPVSGFDRATLGHPGKYTYCIAEDEANSPWEPLHAARGLPAEVDAASVFAAEAPRQVYNEYSPTPEGILDSIAATIADPGNLIRVNLGEYVVVIGGQHRGVLAAAGWSRADVQRYLHERARLTGAEVRRAGKLPWPWDGGWTPADDELLMTLAAGPESIHVIAAGSLAGGFSAGISPYGGKTSTLVTKPIGVCIDCRDSQGPALAPSRRESGSGGESLAQGGRMTTGAGHGD